MNDTVIFLDFDGVIRLSPAVTRGLPEIPFKYIDEFCSERIRLLVVVAKQSGSKIVISSDWRRDYGKEQIKVFLGELAEYLHEDWATVCSSGSRWEEISTWLDKHTEVGNYAILDDMDSHFKGCPYFMRERLVLCNNRYGMVPKTFSKLWRIVNQGRSSFIWLDYPRVAFPEDDEL